MILSNLISIIILIKRLNGYIPGKKLEKNLKFFWLKKPQNGLISGENDVKTLQKLYWGRS